MSILSCLIKSSHDAVFIAEVETGRIAYANEAACKLSGYSLDEIIGKMSIKNADNPAVYERVQFMKHFAGIE